MHFFLFNPWQYLFSKKIKLLKFSHKISMICRQKIDKHFFLLTGFIMLHSIHKLIEGLPAARTDVIFQPSVHNYFFLAHIDAVVPLHISGYPRKLLICYQTHHPVSYLQNLSLISFNKTVWKFCNRSDKYPD